MEMNRLRTGVAGLTGVVCCVLLAVLGPDMPDQAAKTLLKFLLLGLAPVLALLWQGGSLRLGCPRQGRRKRRLLAALAYLIFTGLALTAARFVDLTPINQALAHDGALSIGLFLTAGLLIAVPGAFLEEFFFRGFCFQLLAADGVPPVTAALFSAGLFSLYHGVMMKGWFPPWQTFVAFWVLFVVGLLFCLACRRMGLCAAWLCHMAANLALLTAGLIWFYL